MKRMFRSGSKLSKGSIETRVTDAVKKFCDSGAPNNPNAGGSEITHLPTIVEGAESSPAAAGAAAYKIRKLIQDAYSKPYIQYNCIMLLRILVDNPGPQFTQHLDDKFVQAIQSCLQSQRDPSVHQILCETLHYFASSKSQDTNLNALLGMWRQQQAANPRRNQQGAPRSHRPHPTPNRLPPPDELAARISEAKASAQLLVQLSESTPPQEVAGNELMKEFADRLQIANRDLHGYMNCTDPAPDQQTFTTLIETCEQLSVASSRHQRAVLAARQVQGHQPQMGGPGQQPSRLSAMPPGSQGMPQQPMQQERSPYARPVSTMDPSQQQSRSQYRQQQPIDPQQQQQRSSMLPPTTTAVTQPLQTSRGLDAPDQGQPRDPFSDDNRLPPASRAPQTNGISMPSSTNVGVYELAGSADEDFAPPTGPPPTKSFPLEQQQQQQQAPYSSITQRPEEDSDDDYDLYNTGNTPIAARSQPNGGAYSQSVSPPRPEVPQGTQSYVRRQDEAGQSLSMHGVGSPPRGLASKIRDDEPMTPLTPSAWR